MYHPVGLFCAFVALTPFMVNAITPEQKAKVHEHFESVGLKCYKDNPITEDDIINLRGKKVASGPNVPCFLACMFKDIGILDSQGMMRKDTVLELAKTVFQDPDEIKLIEDYLHSCSHINSETVADGEKGCERAVLGYKCMIENAAQFGFDV